MTKAYNVENILDDPNITEVLPDNTAIAFYWVAREYGISIGEKNTERVKKFSQLEPQRTFYVVVHGLSDQQIDELNKSFSEYPNIKVLNFKSLKLDNQYDLPNVEFIKNGEEKKRKASSYWDDMYSKEVITRMHFSNEIDLMKYHLAVNSDQIVGPDKPLAVFDFGTLPAEGKKIGEVKIIKGGVLLAYLSKDFNRRKRLDLPILAISKEGNEILCKAIKNGLRDCNSQKTFSEENYLANKMINAINHQNVSKTLEIIGLNESSSEYEEMYDEIYDKADQLFAFNRTENVMIISDKSLHYKNYYKNYTSDTEEEQVNNNTATKHINTSEPTTSTTPQQKQPINGAPQTVASNATPFEEIPTKSEINNNLQSEEQDSQTPITTDNSNFLGISTRGWIIISTCAIVGGAIGATLVATGIIPAIIGLIATAILAGATGVVTGGAIGAGMACLTKIVINKYCGEEAAAQPV